MTEREPDWDTVMEMRAEMERDARACDDADVTFPADSSPATPLSDWDW